MFSLLIDASSKHASQAFFDSLRAEVVDDGINVTVVNPGYIKTNLSMNAFSPDGTKHGGLLRYFLFLLEV